MLCFMVVYGIISRVNLKHASNVFVGTDVTVSSCRVYRFERLIKANFLLRTQRFLARNSVRLLASQQHRSLLNKAAN